MTIPNVSVTRFGDEINNGVKAVVCYEVVESSTATYNSLQYSWLAGSFDNGSFDSVFNSSPPGAVGTFAPIPVHDGTNWITDGSVEAELAIKVIPLLQTQWPVIDAVKLTVDSGGTLFIDFYDASNPGASLSGNTLGIGGASQIFVLGEATVEVGSPTTPVQIKHLQVNGMSTYYENGVFVTDPSRIADIEALIATATQDQIFTCPPDGSETIVTAGSNVAVTGVGTTADPYVVSASGALTYTTAFYATTNSVQQAPAVTPANVTEWLTEVMNIGGGVWTPLTGEWAAPKAGLYQIEAGLGYNRPNWASDDFARIHIAVNGVRDANYVGEARAEGAGSFVNVVTMSRLRQLNAGDKVSIQCQAAQASNGTLANLSGLTSMQYMHILGFTA